MTHLRRQDADLHHSDGSHRSTPPTTRGTMLANHERRLRAHLAEHAAQERKEDDDADEA